MSSERQERTGEGKEPKPDQPTSKHSPSKKSRLRTLMLFHEVLSKPLTLRENDPVSR